MEIIINARKVTIEGDQLTHEKIVELAHPGSKAVHSVTYRHVVPFYQLTAERDGLLIPGQSVQATPGMVINAMVTGAA